jgi:hypothetical protein
MRQTLTFEEEGDKIFEWHRERLAKNARVNRAHNLYLNSLKRRVGSSECSCGKGHKVVEFIEIRYEDEEVVVETRCPENWWRSMVGIKLSEGTATKFVTENPLSKYLKMFEVKDATSRNSRVR